MWRSKGVVLLNDQPLKELHEAQRSTFKLGRFQICCPPKALKPQRSGEHNRFGIVINTLATSTFCESDN